MATTPPAGSKITRKLLEIGLALPATQQDVACKGTALESATVTVRKKAFLFVRVAEARFKVTASRREIEVLARNDPAHYAIGSTGWAQIKFADGQSPAAGRLVQWIGESFAAAGGVAKKRAR